MGFFRLRMNFFHRRVNGHFSKDKFAKKKSSGDLISYADLLATKLEARDLVRDYWSISLDDKERYQSGGQRLCKFTEAKESVYIRKEFLINSNRIDLEHQHGRYFVVLENQFGRRDVM